MEFLHKYEQAMFAMPVTLSHLYELEEERRVLTVKGAATTILNASRAKGVRSTSCMMSLREVHACPVRA